MDGFVFMAGRLKIYKELKRDLDTGCFEVLGTIAFQFMSAGQQSTLLDQNADAEYN